MIRRTTVLLTAVALTALISVGDAQAEQAMAANGAAPTALRTGTACHYPYVYPQNFWGLTTTKREDMYFRYPNEMRIRSTISSGRTCIPGATVLPGPPHEAGHLLRIHSGGGNAVGAAEDGLLLRFCRGGPLDRFRREGRQPGNLVALQQAVDASQCGSVRRLPGRNEGEGHSSRPMRPVRTSDAVVVAELRDVVVVMWEMLLTSIRKATTPRGHEVADQSLAEVAHHAVAHAAPGRRGWRPPSRRGQLVDLSVLVWCGEDDRQAFRASTGPPTTRTSARDHGK